MNGVDSTKLSLDAARGIGLGEIVGASVGETLGTSVGASVGESDGASEGASVGTSVGTWQVVTASKKYEPLAPKLPSTTIAYMPTGILKLVHVLHSLHAYLRYPNLIVVGV